MPQSALLPHFPLLHKRNPPLTLTFFRSPQQPRTHPRIITIIAILLSHINIQNRTWVFVALELYLEEALIIVDLGSVYL